jgi:peptide/nickel transport system ATP-binding protein
MGSSTRHREPRARDMLSLTIEAIAGESGSGRTTLANAVLGFVTPSAGSVLYRGMDVSRLRGRERLRYRRQVQAGFQDPYAVYNPFYRIRHTFDQVIKRFKLAPSNAAARRLVENGLNIVGLRGDDFLDKHPHQLSGGQRQRIMLAGAHLLRPRLIVADEPVSMVDASLRAMILEVMARMRDEFGISFLYITHDLSTAYQVADEIIVLYAVRVAERGDAARVIERPRHPYVDLLVRSVPVPDPRRRWDSSVVLPVESERPDADQSGCLHHPRCPHAMDRCLDAPPPLFDVADGRQHAACYLYDPAPTEPEPDSGGPNPTTSTRSSPVDRPAEVGDGSDPSAVHGR